MKIKYFYLLIFAICIAAPVKNTFNVEGMMCGYGCVSKINSIVSELNGVKECNVSFEKSSLVVVYDNINLDSELIIKSLPNPYVVTLVSESITKSFIVEGITCMGCVNSINLVLDEIDGILQYSVSLDGEMEIEMNVEKFDKQKMYQAMPEKFKIVEVLEEKNKE